MDVLKSNFVMAFLYSLRIVQLGKGIALAVMLLAASIGGVSGYTLVKIYGFGETWKAFDEGPAEKAAVLNKLRGAIGFGGVIHQFKDFILDQDQPRVALIQEKVRQVVVQVVNYRALGINDQEDRALNAIQGVVEEYAAALAVAQRLAGQGSSIAEIQAAIAINDAPALQGMAALDEQTLAARQSSATELTGAVYSTIYFFLVGATFCFFLVAAIVACILWFTSSRLRKPLESLGGAMEALASGDKTIDIPYADQQDEMGEMARTVQVFKENAIETERLTEEQRRMERQQAEESQRRTLEDAQAKQKAEEDERQRERKAEEQKQKMAAEAEQRRKTDEEEARTKQAAERKEFVEKLTTDFDTMMSAVLDKFTTALNDVGETARSMSETAKQTSQQSIAVASATEQASTNVQTVASATEELSVTTQEISRQVAQSTEMSLAAVEEAKRTNSQVEALTEGARRIGDVVQMINDIASQTNLLALNATIEAARAGSAGKGFAVVASEVKSLAEQTTKATDDISVQIEAIQTVTSDAVSAIAGIVTTINNMSDIAMTISASVEQQGAATIEIADNVQQAALGTQEVSRNIATVTETASETGSAADNVLAATGGLTEEARNLRKAVDKFLEKMRSAA